MLSLRNPAICSKSNDSEIVETEIPSSIHSQKVKIGDIFVCQEVDSKNWRYICQEVDSKNWRYICQEADRKNWRYICQEADRKNWRDTVKKQKQYVYAPKQMLKENYVEADDSDSSVGVEETELNSDDDSGSSQNNKSEDNSSGSKDGSEDDDQNINAGWADSLAKILKTNKPKGKKSLVLSRAKKISDIKKVKTEKSDFEVVGDVKEEKLTADELKLIIPGEDEDEPKNKKRRENPNFRVKPTVLEKEREKILSKIATRGVVQLFNAVRNQQKDIEKKMEAAGPLERKKDKVLKSLDKNKFLDTLMGQSKSDIVNQSASLKKESKKEIKDEEPSSWNVFREDFMMGAKMKDWDKKEKQNGTDEVSELSESDSE